MSKYPYISQVDQRDCGVAALAMILKNYGSSYSLAYLRSWLRLLVKALLRLAWLKQPSSWVLKRKLFVRI